VEDTDIASSWVKDAGEVANLQPVQVVAAFDFDKTLTVADTVVPFVRQFASRTKLLGIFISNFRQNFQALLRLDRNYIKDHVLAKALEGISVRNAEEIAERYADFVVAHMMRQDTCERLRWHQREGHKVVLVSASFEIYLQRVASRIGVEHVLGTRLATTYTAEGDVVFTGALDGENCRGVEKVQRFREWVAGESASIFQYAYGDSRGDDELLAAAAFGQKVNRITLRKDS